MNEIAISPRATPVVSVVTPMLNEAGFIEDLLAAVARQTWPLESLEFVVVDSGCSDGSREIVERFALTHPWVRVVDNPRRRQSSGWRTGLECAEGEYVCCINAHALPAPVFVEQSVRVLRETGAAGVGGRVVHQGRDTRSTAIGLAMASPVGMASPHRFASGRCEVDTISHPAYLRSATLSVGLHDESLERNSDYELNWRLREAGGRLIFDDSIQSVYRPRGSLSSLWRQFWWYGEWKVEVLRRHPRSLRVRHAVAPTAVAAGGALMTLSWLPRARKTLAASAGLYFGGLITATVIARPHRHGASTATYVAAFPVMHIAWGSGFLYSLVRPPSSRGNANARGIGRRRHHL